MIRFKEIFLGTCPAAQVVVDLFKRFKRLEERAILYMVATTRSREGRLKRIYKTYLANFIGYRNRDVPVLVPYYDWLL